MAREAEWYIIRLAGQAPHRCLPLTSNVRPHAHPLRRTAAMNTARWPNAASQGVRSFETSLLQGRCERRLRRKDAMRGAGACAQWIKSKVEASYAAKAEAERKNSGTQRLGPARRVVKNQVSVMRCVRQGASGAGCSWGIHSRRHCPRVRPNPSVKRTRAGLAPGPRGLVVYRRPHGPGASPSRAAYLER